MKLPAPVHQDVRQNEAGRSYANEYFKVAVSHAQYCSAPGFNTLFHLEEN